MQLVALGAAPAARAALQAQAGQAALQVVVLGPRRRRALAHGQIAVEHVAPVGPVACDAVIPLGVDGHWFGCDRGG